MTWLLPYRLATATATIGLTVVQAGLTLDATATRSRYEVEGTNGAITTGAAIRRVAVAPIGTAIASGQIGNTGSTTADALVKVVATVYTTAASAGGTLTVQANASAAGALVPRAGVRASVRKVA